MDKKEISHLLNIAIEEIKHSQNPNKDESTQKVYLSNAIRFIKTAIEGLNS